MTSGDFINIHGVVLQSILNCLMP